MKNLKLFLIIGLCLSCLLLDAQNITEQLYESLEWRNVGPFRGGRSCAVTGVTGNHNLYYFGSTGGGVWKTEDAGDTWENISDGFFGGSIGSVAVAESDENVIYVGGGEKTVRGNVSYGYGIWKSVDAGKTWEQKGLKQSRHISRIRIHPNDPNIAYAAVMGDLFKSSEERGVYKTVDGGETWTKVLFANEDAGAVDLIIDPTNHRVLYASTWRIRRTPYSLSSGGEGSALWKSTDSGETWTNISENKGLPEGTLGIIGIAVSPVKRDRVWALVENENGGVFRSEDGGENWVKVNSSRSLRQRAWYYTRIYADTEDSEVVYVVNVDYHKSKDGGKTFESFRAPHGDHHDLWIDPTDSKNMIIGDDGGAQVSLDGGENWTTYHNQSTSQFYRVTTDDHFPFRIYAAQQDNSTIRISHRTFGGSIDEDDWEATAGGESAHITIDPRDNDVVYGGSYDGFLTRVNHKTGEVRAINVWPDNPMGHGAEGMKYRFQWNFPMFVSKHDPTKLYAFSNHAHVSQNEGQSWEILSNDLTRNDPEKLKSSGGPITKDNTSVEYYCTIFAAKESSLKEGLIWIGTDDGLVHITQDGGNTWSDITPKDLPEWTMINCIEPSPFDEGTCYIAGTRYKLGDYEPYIYKTTNYGKSWTKLVEGIDQEHFTRAIRTDKTQQGLLYAGTESGMYVSYDDGKMWHSLQLNLPIVPITDLAVKGEHLIAATQGRGLWIIDDLELIRQSMNFDAAPNAHLFKPKDSYRIPGRQIKGLKKAGTNHYAGVGLYYYINEYTEEDSIKMEILDSGGSLIKAFSNHSKDKKEKLEVKQGSNMFAWNLSYPDAKDFEKMILWWGSLSGPRAVPGTYTAVLTVNGESFSQEFNVLKNPKSSGSIEDIAKQFEFIQSVNQTLSDAHQSITDIRKIKSQLKDYKNRVKEELEISESIARIDSMLTDIEKTLYQTKNQSRQDPLNFPIRLTNKLAHLNSLTQMGDYPPTDQAIVVRDELTLAINAQISAFRKIKETDLQELNIMIKKKEIDAILIE